MSNTNQRKYPFSSTTDEARSHLVLSHGEGKKKAQNSEEKQQLIAAHGHPRNAKRNCFT
jgi:metallophosphoesterase superfamily enzyme